MSHPRRISGREHGRKQPASPHKPRQNDRGPEDIAEESHLVDPRSFEADPVDFEDLPPSRKPGEVTRWTPSDGRIERRQSRQMLTLEPTQSSFIAANRVRVTSGEEVEEARPVQVVHECYGMFHTPPRWSRFVR
jgi:hypothetical protein